ncbi:hypothetical protein Gotur_022112 [Gossypium turneri]
MEHVSVLVKGWTWIPDNLDNLYSCQCGMSCLWTKSPVLADKPDALLFETATPPLQKGKKSEKCKSMQYITVSKSCLLKFVLLLLKAELVSQVYHLENFMTLGLSVTIAIKAADYQLSAKKASSLTAVFQEILSVFLPYSHGSYNIPVKRLCMDVLRHSGDPLRVYMDLEAGRRRSGREDLFISYHAKDDVQSTYAGALFHNGRNYHISSYKNNETLVYWSSSRCLSQRNQLAKSFLRLLPHHSFGKCLNNVGGLDMALSFYPECTNDANTPKWWDHLHCAMSHYKFVLAIENTVTESYVTEKLFYALDSGAVPIYFGAPNVLDFVPPHSIIDGTTFRSMEELASYVKALANDPVAYAEYHAWRRCGVLGNYAKARATSLDTLPCRLCEAVSKKGGRNARTE